jgi:DNA-binding NarL/FixJ family response regulator
MKRPKIRVFLVDDHPLVREWLGNLLRLEPDFDLCGQAGEAPPALAAMTAQPPDIAVVDLSLKHGSGLELIKSLRVQAPSTRIVVLSMHEDIGDIERALRAGALGYVTKREATGQIVAAIRQVHSGKLYADTAVLTALAERNLARPPGTAPASPEALSDRELDVFRRVGAGHSTRRIADDLNLGIKTVQTYHARIREKFGLADSTELMQAAVRWFEEKK